MGRTAKYNWDELLKEYLKSDCKNKTEFAKSKGINPSLLRRNTADWPIKNKVSKKRNANGNNSKGKALPKNKASKTNNVPAVVIPVKDKLTEKQQLFCYFFVHNRNATQAAIKAGYSPNTARVIGYENLTKPYIRAEVERLKKLRRQSIMLDPDDIVERYMRIAFSDITDFAEFGLEEVPEVDSAGCILLNPDGTVKTRKYNYMNFKDSNQVDGGLICEISQGRSGLKVKLEDRQKALSWLTDYFNMNPMNQHKQRYDNAVLKLREDEAKLKNF